MWADDPRIAAQHALPQVMADNDSADVAFLVEGRLPWTQRLVRIVDPPKQQRLSTKRHEHIVVRAGGADALHALADTDVRVDANHRSQAFEEIWFSLQIERLRARNSSADLSARIGVHEDETIGIGVRKLLPEHRVDHAEHGGVRTDDQRERGNDDEREARGPRQHAEPVSEVADERLESPADSTIADAFFYLLDAPDLDQRRASCSVRRQAAGGVIRRALVGECLQFVIQIAVEIG